MQQINQSITVISPGDPFQESFSSYIKIYLSGSLDLIGGKTKIPWQQKFINGLASLTDPKAKPVEGLPQLSTFKFLIMNPLFQAQNQQEALENPEFVQKLQWETSCYQQADVIFCNFLRGGRMPSSLEGLLLNATSGKVIVRCPVDSIFYPRISVYSQIYRYPLIGDSASLITVLQTMFQTNQKLIELLNYNIQ